MPRLQAAKPPLRTRQQPHTTMEDSRVHQVIATRCQNRPAQPSAAQRPPAPCSAPQPGAGRVMGAQKHGWQGKLWSQGHWFTSLWCHRWECCCKGCDGAKDVLALEAKYGPGSSRMLGNPQLPSPHDGGTHQLSVKRVQGEPESHSTPLAFGNCLHPVGILAAR